MIIGFIDSLSSKKWLSGIGQSNKIINIIEKTDFTKKDDGKKYIVLSQLFESRRDYKRAIGILMEGLDILPKDYDLMRYTGILLYKQGRYKEADLILEKAIEMDNEDPDIKRIKRILDNSLLIKTRKNNITEV